MQTSPMHPYGVSSTHLPVRREKLIWRKTLNPKKITEYAKRILRKEKAPEQPITHHLLQRESEALGIPHEGQTFSERIEELFDNPTDVLGEFSTVFPFDLFPDTIRIDPLKIQITARKFFASAQIRNILIKDIDDVLVETAPFFATVKIIIARDKEHPVCIKPLKKNDAKRIGKIIAGLVIGRSEAADVSRVEAIRS